MTFQFSDDKTYLFIKNDDGSISGMPTKYLTDEDKAYVYEEMAGETF